MFRLIKFLLVFIILIGLVLFFTPLNLYYNYLEKEIKPLRLSEISGSIIKGESQSLSYLGLDLGRANWLLYPNSWNRVALDLQLNAKDYDVKTQVNKDPQRLSLKNTQGTVDWALIEKYANFNKGKISGYFALDFSEIAFENNSPVRIEGKAVTRELKMIRPMKKDLGEIEIDFRSDNPSFIVGTVNSRSNVLNVSGAVYIHKNHRWEVKLNIIPMPGEYEMEYALQGIGERRRGGGRTFNLAGFY